MKEINYVIDNSPITNEIFVGTLNKPNKRGFTMWRTRKTLTKEAIHCVIEHYIRLTEEEIKKSSGKGIEWTFKPNNDYDIKLSIKKIARTDE